ncbi:unnamed protein product [Aspergillus oryzae]|nr:unnamed protein product [Aspergillus oryzae]
MTMFSNEHLEKLLEERKRLAESRGFTLEYQQEQEKIENTVCHPRIAPATEEKYERAIRWRLSRSEPKDANLTREDPDPTPQQLKLFAESYVVSRKTKPSQKSACNNFTCFTSKWERETSRTLPLGLKKDVLNVRAAHVLIFITGATNYRPKNWFREHPVPGKSFVFWVIVHGIADGAFKGISTVEELLEKRPPKGRESWTLEWKEDVKELPFFRMTTSQGPKADEAWTFSSLRHHLTSLAERDGFRDRLRVHGIRGAMANKIDRKALDHMDHDSYLKYQSSLKAVDMMALYYDLDPDYECREMEQSMAHHRDQNVPLRLDAASLAEFEKDEEVILINQRISELTQEIRGRPDKHADLVSERSKLYTRKAKKLRTKRSEFIENWWNVCYDEYITGNDFLERDTTCLFQIYRKYMPERARLNDNIFKQVPLDSDIGRQCLRDAVSLCTSVEKVAYYPGMTPVEGKCPICAKQMSRNGKRAHRHTRRSFVQFCYLCAELICNEEDWINHCQSHLQALQPRCGLLTFRYTLVAAGLCPFCLGDEKKRADERFQQWVKKATLLNHIDRHLENLPPEGNVSCPHPCCNGRQYSDVSDLRRHFFNRHSIAEPRSNCVARKRKWAETSMALESVKCDRHLEGSD